MASASPDEHPFRSRPHRTVLALSFPVLISLVAEPITGLVDTAFVATLGIAELAALGVGSIVLSTIGWIFNFLGVSTQTEVARASGANTPDRGREICGLALLLAAGFGLVFLVLAPVGADATASLMGAEGAVQNDAALYMSIRAVGLPAIMVLTVAFGAMRGLQDMRTPLVIAVTINALNVLLDWLLIFGAGPIPAFGIGGAAWASVISQWIGAVWAVVAVRSRLGFPTRLHASDVRLLLVVGGDLFVRTAMLTLFLLLVQRTATPISAEAGAAHQAIRQVWFFTALFLDAFAATAQSLVGYFLGAGHGPLARRVVRVTIGHGLVAGLLLSATMLLLADRVADWLVPVEAHSVFATAWLVGTLPQPILAVSFVTDGILWGTRDYRYLRNTMLVSTGLGAIALGFVDGEPATALALVWGVQGGWVALRAGFGLWRALRL